MKVNRTEKSCIGLAPMFAKNSTQCVVGFVFIINKFTKRNIIVVSWLHFLSSILKNNENTMICLLELNLLFITINLKLLCNNNLNGDNSTENVVFSTALETKNYGENSC